MQNVEIMKYHRVGDMQKSHGAQSINISVRWCYLCHMVSHVPCHYSSPTVSRNMACDL